LFLGIGRTVNRNGGEEKKDGVTVVNNGQRDQRGAEGDLMSGAYRKKTGGAYRGLRGEGAGVSM